jgi:hypothetical protein
VSFEQQIVLEEMGIDEMLKFHSFDKICHTVSEEEDKKVNVVFGDEGNKRVKQVKGCGIKRNEWVIIFCYMEKSFTKIFQDLRTAVEHSLIKIHFVITNLNCFREIVLIKQTGEALPMTLWNFGWTEKAGLNETNLWLQQLKEPWHEVFRQNMVMHPAVSLRKRKKEMNLNRYQDLESVSSYPESGRIGQTTRPLKLWIVTCETRISIAVEIIHYRVQWELASRHWKRFQQGKCFQDIDDWAVLWHRGETNVQVKQLREISCNELRDASICEQSKKVQLQRRQVGTQFRYSSDDFDWKIIDPSDLKSFQLRMTREKLNEPRMCKGRVVEAEICQQWISFRQKKIKSILTSRERERFDDKTWVSEKLIRIFVILKSPKGDLKVFDVSLDHPFSLRDIRLKAGMMMQEMVCSKVRLVQTEKLLKILRLSKEEWSSDDEAR